MVRRLVRARMGADHPDSEDVIQEVLTRVLAATDRVQEGMLEPYAIATVRNVVVSAWRSQDRERRHRHRWFQPDDPGTLDEEVLAGADRAAMAAALARLSPRERELLLGHEVEGTPTKTFAAQQATTPGAVAARLARLRAQARVEYLIALTCAEPPTESCRDVLIALSRHERRRKLSLDADGHLLHCAYCTEIAGRLAQTGRPTTDVVVAIARDADVVLARREARAAAARVGFGATDLTLIATAVSEIARDIVKFADSGQIVVSELGRDGPGVLVVARDVGPGIPTCRRRWQTATALRRPGNRAPGRASPHGRVHDRVRPRLRHDDHHDQAGRDRDPERRTLVNDVTNRSPFDPALLLPELVEHLRDHRGPLRDAVGFPHPGREAPGGDGPP